MTYRDEGDAARERRDALRRELAEIDAAIGDGAPADAHRAALRASLEHAERALDRARARVALPLLSKVSVARPCHARWEDMRGDDRARHCASCDKTVFDLSAMRAEEAEALLREHGAGACVRFYRRADGTVMTADCPVGVARARRRGWALAAGITAVAAAGVVTAGALAAALVIAADEPEPQYVMGAMPMPLEPTEVQGGVSFADDAPPHSLPPHALPPHVARPDATDAPEGERE